MQTARKISQIFFLLFFVTLFLIARFPYEHGIDSDIGLRFSPLIPLFDFIKNLSTNWSYWPALLIIFATIFLGRFFCSWICPLGTTLDISDKFIKSPKNALSSKWNKFRFLKFAILVGLIILAIFSVNAWGYMDPLSIFNRVLTAILYPLATLFGENILLTLGKVSFLEKPAFFVYDAFKNNIMPEGQAFYQQVFWITLFFASILGMEKLSRRFWCRYLCPAGALLGFLSQFRFYERIVGNSCTVCNKCQTGCKMDAIPEGDIKFTSKVECIECFNCGAACPPKAKSITYQWRWKPYHTPVNYDRRQFVKTSAVSLGSLGLLSIGLNNKAEKDRLIRPPGALSEADFQDVCIRCLECVRICESNGGCLQPDTLHTSILDLWLPVAIMREGYCEYNCNLCGQVCPTEAIQPLELKTKKNTVMGLAYFNKNTCIPYARNEDCIVCEEHCPTPDKAIKFEVKEYTSVDGATRSVKYPFVVKELCIGCGICENKCPLPGEAGIVVKLPINDEVNENSYY